MNETLHDKAALNLRAARMLHSVKETDESMINIVGYHVQQAVELELKHLLEINGVAYPKTHNIGQLMDALDESGVYTLLTSRTEILNQVNMFAGTFTEWESKTRYIKNFRLGIRQLDMGLEIATKLLAFEDKTNLFG